MRQFFILIFSFLLIASDVCADTAISTAIHDWDDGLELDTGQMRLDSWSFTLGNHAEYSGDILAALRFPGVAVPQGATINSANIGFNARFGGSTSVSVEFSGELIADSTRADYNYFGFTNRSKTVASVAWNNIPNWSSNNNYTSVDIGSIIQEIVELPEWQSGNALTIFVTNTGPANGRREAKAYDNYGSSQSPQLTVDFLTGPPPPPDLVLAVIGDYGLSATAPVAALIDGWDVDAVITTGDNNYPSGEAGTIDTRIGQHYSQYIGNYQGVYGPGSTTNAFFPTLGNHDWDCAGCPQPYFDYFTLPGEDPDFPSTACNGRYYDFVLGDVHFFMLDSDPREPHGYLQSSTQAKCLEVAMGVSSSVWKIVVLHHSPYSSEETHQSDPDYQWPFESWGADIVLSAHSHVYERLSVGASNFPYIVQGLGGGVLRGFGAIDTNSVVRYSGKHGATKIGVTSSGLIFDTYTIDDELIDSFTLQK